MAKGTSILIGILLFTAWAAHAQTSVPRDTLITLRRITDAFNNGTDYKLTISADGTVVFKRIANPAVDISDPRARPSEPIQSRIPVNQVALLVAEVERIKYFSLKDRYAAREDGCPNAFADQGGAETSITINGKTKTIGHYYGCSQEPFGPSCVRSDKPLSWRHSIILFRSSVMVTPPEMKVEQPCFLVGISGCFSEV